MSKAKEMFEALGYEYSNQDEEVAVCKKIYKENKCFRQYITFNKMHKIIDASMLDTVLTLEELKAVIEQIEELKWLYIQGSLTHNKERGKI